MLGSSRKLTLAVVAQGATESSPRSSASARAAATRSVSTQKKIKNLQGSLASSSSRLQLLPSRLALRTRYFSEGGGAGGDPASSSKFARPGRPGPGRGPPVAPGSRNNAANYLAAVLIAATFGWAGWMYKEKTGPFALTKSKEQVAKEKALAEAKLQWQLARDPLNAKVTDRVFFDIAINGKPAGRVVLGLFGEAAPKTVANFLAFSGPEGVSAPESVLGKSGKNLSYKGTRFHRVIPKFMIQGGDVTVGDGSGGYSIYGESFPDEEFDLWHVRPGVVSMANRGPNTNSSQFFITTAATPWLDERHVVFGRVLDGYRTVRQVERLGSDSGKPLRRIEIAKCGILTEEEYSKWVEEQARRRAELEKEAARE